MATLPIKLNDGTTIPWLAFGSGTAFLRQDAHQGVAAAIKAGFRHIDTAQRYENEDSVSEGIAASGVPRSELYITTKLGLIPEGKTVRDTLLESLRKLRTDYVDLFLIHNPFRHPDLQSTWKDLEALQAEGLTRSIGVSNFQVYHLNTILETAKVIPAVNQIEYHPYVAKASAPQLELHKKHNIVTTSYGGLGPLVHFKGGPIEPVLDKVAARLSDTSGKSVTQGQVLQLWLRKKGIPCITTSVKADRILEYVGVGELPDITDAEEKEIDDVGSSVHHRAIGSDLVDVPPPS